MWTGILRECIEAGNLLITPETAYLSEQSVNEFREAAASEVRRAIMGMTASSAAASNPSSSLSTPNWTDALRYCLNSPSLNSNSISLAANSAQVHSMPLLQTQAGLKRSGSPGCTAAVANPVHKNAQGALSRVATSNATALNNFSKGHFNWNLI